MKTEKKTVQFSEEIQVETIEPEQEPVYIDEVTNEKNHRIVNSFMKRNGWSCLLSSSIGSCLNYLY